MQDQNEAHSARKILKNLNSLYQRFIDKTQPRSRWDSTEVFLQSIDRGPYRNKQPIDLVRLFTSDLQMLSELIALPFEGNWLDLADFEAFKLRLNNQLVHMQRVKDLSFMAGANMLILAPCVIAATLISAHSGTNHQGYFPIHDPVFLAIFVVGIVTLLVSSFSLAGLDVMYPGVNASATLKVLDIFARTADIVGRAEKAGMIGPIPGMIPVPLPPEPEDQDPILQMAGLL